MGTYGKGDLFRNSCVVSLDVTLHHMSHYTLSMTKTLETGLVICGLQFS